MRLFLWVAIHYIFSLLRLVNSDSYAAETGITLVPLLTENSLSLILSLHKKMTPHDKFRLFIENQGPWLLHYQTFKHIPLSYKSSKCGNVINFLGFSNQKDLVSSYKMLSVNHFTVTCAHIQPEHVNAIYLGLNITYHRPIYEYPKVSYKSKAKERHLVVRHVCSFSTLLPQLRPKSCR